MGAVRPNENSRDCEAISPPSEWLFLCKEKRLRIPNICAINFTMRKNFFTPVKITLTVLAFALSLVTIVSCSEKKSSVAQSVISRKLDNGLSLFMTENHTVPLVYIEIAVRSGAVSQTKEDAGLFHLYEHMMFKGNALYPDAASVQNAISKMGVASWNGTTSVDRVNYYFTIPSDRLEEGLAFWNAAIRTPLMKEEELENEKKVVLAEIKGDASEPSRVARSHLTKTLFPDSPYKVDPAGSVPVVENASVAQLRDIQSRYYIPGNAALFVGGDINPERTEQLVKEIFGTWKNNGNTVTADFPQASMTPFNSVQYRVIADENVSPDLAQVNVSYRGPDAEFAEKDTYTADILLNLTDEAAGIFSQTIIADQELAIPDPAYVNTYYGTSRRSGIIDFTGVLPNAKENLIARTEKFRSVSKDAFAILSHDKSSFSKKKIASVVQGIFDSETMSSQTASSILSTLCFWWTCTEPEYYFNYHKNLSKVTLQDASDFYSRYVENAFPLVTLSIHPDLYAELKDDLSKAGYLLMTEENSYWWKEETFAPDKSLLPEQVTYVPEEKIYVPKNEKSDEETNAFEKNDDVKEVHLSNGIPVYFKSMPSSQVLTVFLGVKGGVLHLTPETSGLEEALFSVMGSSSEKYSFDEREALLYRTSAGISTWTKLSGSALTLNCVSSYADEMLPVLLDGFLHPAYEKKFMDMLSLSNRQSVQGMLNTPSSILSYTATKELFKNHPYGARVSVQPESLESITEENLKSLHEKLLDASKIFLVCTGNFNEKKLLSEFEKTLGSLPSHAEDLSDSISIPPVDVSGDTLVLTHPACGSGGFAGRYFAAPANESEDSVPAIIASDLYSSLLFCVVREHYGACYTPSSGISSSHASVGVDYLYRLSDIKNFRRYMEEAQALMEKGMLIDSVGKDGAYVYTSLENKLEGAKNSYITRTYGSSATSYGVASSLTYNILQYDDLYFDRKQLAQVRSLKSEDILSVFKKYWVDAPSRWFIIVADQNYL